jgi:N-methylhydantoinase B
VNQAIDAIDQEIIYARLIGVVQEMQNALFRTGYSTIIRESQDASCALTDARGRVIAQQTVLPLHLGAFPACVEGVLEAYKPEDMQPGDAYIVNHPYFGGSPHANDMAAVTPLFHRDQLVAFCGSIAHKSDIGGMAPGSGPGSAREIYQEGLHLPPVRYVQAGRLSRELEVILRANSRTPDLVVGDLEGQVGCARLGERRFLALLDKYGLEAVESSWLRSFEQVERRVRQAIAGWSDGAYEGEAFLDSDSLGSGQPARVHVIVTVTGDRLNFDFRGSDPQAVGPSNIRPPLVRAACYYVLKCLVDPELPSNAGLAAVVEAEFKPGTIVDPILPAAVNTYIPTAQAVVEASLRALAPLTPAREIAGSGGTGAVALGGQGFVQYELFGSGLGARRGKDGVSGTSVHVGNSRITPIEIIESEFPVKVRRFELIPDSGGAGRWRGGLGFAREYAVLADARLSTRLDKHQVAPFGIEGGLPGAAGSTRINPGSPAEKSLPARSGDVAVAAGDTLLIERPGGGGFGDPRARPVEDVLRDVREGYVSAEAARELYGVDPTTGRR